MPQSASRSELRFLLDENVKSRVGKFLESGGFDVLLAPKGFSDGRLADISKTEGLLILTADIVFGIFCLVTTFLLEREL